MLDHNVKLQMPSGHTTSILHKHILLDTERWLKKPNLPWARLPEIGPALEWEPLQHQDPVTRTNSQGHKRTTEIVHYLQTLEIYCNDLTEKATSLHMTENKVKCKKNSKCTKWLDGSSSSRIWGLLKVIFAKATLLFWPPGQQFQFARKQSADIQSKYKESSVLLNFRSIPIHKLNYNFWGRCTFRKNQEDAPLTSLMRTKDVCSCNLSTLNFLAPEEIEGWWRRRKPESVYMDCNARLPVIPNDPRCERRRCSNTP